MKFCVLEFHFEQLGNNLEVTGAFSTGSDLFIHLLERRGIRRESYRIDCESRPDWPSGARRTAENAEN